MGFASCESANSPNISSGIQCWAGKKKKKKCSRHHLCLTSGSLSNLSFTTQVVPAGLFSALGFFLWLNSTRWKGRSIGGKERLIPQFPVSDQHLTGERGRVLESLRYPSNDWGSRHPSVFPKGELERSFSLGLKNKSKTDTSESDFPVFLL